jgi:hypothetical protein
MYKKFLRTLRVLAAALVINVISAPLTGCSDAGRLSALMSEWVTAEKDRARCVPFAQTQGVDVENWDSVCPGCLRSLWGPRTTIWEHAMPYGSGFNVVVRPGTRLSVDRFCARWVEAYDLTSLGEEINNRLRERIVGAPVIAKPSPGGGSDWGGFVRSLMVWARWHDELRQVATKKE